MRPVLQKSAPGVLLELVGLFTLAKDRFETAEKKLNQATVEEFGIRRKEYIDAGIAYIRAAAKINNNHIVKLTGDALINQGVNLDQVPEYQKAKKELETVVAAREHEQQVQANERVRIEEERRRFFSVRPSVAPVTHYPVSIVHLPQPAQVSAPARQNADMSSADLAFNILCNVGIFAQSRSDAEKRFFAEIAPSIAQCL